MRRTITDARQHLTDIATIVNPEAYRQYDNEVRNAEAEVKQRAAAHVQTIYDETLPAARQVSERLCEVRDSARQLVDQIAAGRISDSDAAAQLERLRSEARTQRSAHADLASRADRIDAVGSDPVAWHVDLAFRFPHMLHDFSF